MIQFRLLFRVIIITITIQCYLLFTLTLTTTTTLLSSAVAVEGFLIPQQQQQQLFDDRSTTRRRNNGVIVHRTWFQNRPSDSIHLSEEQFPTSSSSSSESEPSAKFRGGLEQSSSSSSLSSSQKSRVSWISSKNLGGVHSLDGQEIRINFPLDSSSFVACTGETGSGKSLLLAKTAEVLCGGKAVKILGPDLGKNGVFAEMEFLLSDSHRRMVQTVLNANKVNIEGGLSNDGRLRCKRSISLHIPKQGKSGKFRLKSACEMNGQPVTLQLLSSVVAPLIAIVDGTRAASAIAKADARASILDAAIPAEIITNVVEKKEVYRKLRKERETLQATVDSQVLPMGYSLDNPADAELLSHWINELDAFKSRVLQLCQCFEGVEKRKSGVLSLCNQLVEADWMSSTSAADSNVNTSALYTILMKLRDKLRALDRNILNAHNALNALTLLASKESVLTAIERSRSFIDEASSGGDSDDETILDAAEQCHDLLNSVEEATKRCAQHLEDDSNGLIQILETERSLCPVSVDVIDGILLDWGTLARKHGVSPASLPACHHALITEQSGCNEALEMLSDVSAKEQHAFNHFVNSCRRLSDMRKQVARSLCSSVNSRLPDLGMKPTFDIRIDSNRLNIPEKLFSLGPDDVEFLLSQNSPSTADTHQSDAPAQGELNVVASAGEKARILLAIECSIPGSVAAACMKGGDIMADESSAKRPAPVLVLYDEIDAHVGGLAATAVAAMLVEQARNYQVLAITHNPAVAALADHHIVVQKHLASSSSVNDVYRGTPVSVKNLAYRDRTQELARMAGGNLAFEEAEAFASALIRDGQNMRKRAESEGNG